MSAPESTSFWVMPSAPVSARTSAGSPLSEFSPALVPSTLDVGAAGRRVTGAGAVGLRDQAVCVAVVSVRAVSVAVLDSVTRARPGRATVTVSVTVSRAGDLRGDRVGDALGDGLGARGRDGLGDGLGRSPSDRSVTVTVSVTVSVTRVGDARSVTVAVVVIGVRRDREGLRRTSTVSVGPVSVTVAVVVIGSGVTVRVS